MFKATTNIIGFIIVIAIVYGILSILVPYDSTDNAEEGDRSGLILYTDHLTGCQYLQAGFYFGGVTPRLDGDGNHVGCKEKDDQYDE